MFVLSVVRTHTNTHSRLHSSRYYARAHTYNCIARPSHIQTPTKKSERTKQNVNTETTFGHRSDVRKRNRNEKKKNSIKKRQKIFSCFKLWEQANFSSGRRQTLETFNCNWYGKLENHFIVSFHWNGKCSLDKCTDVDDAWRHSLVYYLFRYHSSSFHDWRSNCKNQMPQLNRSCHEWTFVLFRILFIEEKTASLFSQGIAILLFRLSWLVRVHIVNWSIVCGSFTERRNLSRFLCARHFSVTSH